MVLEARVVARRFTAARVRDAAPLFAALGEPTRLGPVVILSTGGPASIAGLSESVDVSRQAVTKHLNVLSEAGLVRGYREGRAHVWEIQPERLADGRGCLERIDEQWGDAPKRLEAFLEKE